MASGAPARGRAGRSTLANSVSPVPSGSGTFSRSVLWGARDVETPRSRLGMVCRSPPHQGKRGRKGDRSSSGSELTPLLYQTRLSNSFQEFLQNRVAPRTVAVRRVEAEMATPFGHHRHQERIVRPFEVPIVLHRNPRIVGGRQHHGRHADFGHVVQGRAKLLVFIDVPQPVARPHETTLFFP